jgi:general secretion pathway protein F
MALFCYKALTERGKKIKGVVDADSYLIAKERLHKQGVMITQLFPVDREAKSSSLPPSLLLSFTRDLGLLLRAGLPVYESLITIEEKYRNHKAHSLFLDLCDSLKNGSSLSTALKKYPKTFDSIYLSMVQAAEETSSLAPIFDQLSLLISRQQKLRKQVFSALTYPAFLGSFCLLVIFSLLFFVIPSMKELFEDRSLHPLTESVLAVSRFVTDKWPFLLAFLTAFSLLLVVFLRDERGKILLQRACLKLPLFKTVLIQSALIRFCRALSILLNGGVPLLNALKLARRVMKQLLLEKVIENAEKRVAEGEKLSVQLKNSDLIPGLVVRMLATAEETGKMAPMLQNIAEIYDEELEKNLAQITTLMQPLILLILGAVVGLILLSVLLPLTDVSSFISTSGD